MKYRWQRQNKLAQTKLYLKIEFDESTYTIEKDGVLCMRDSVETDAAAPIA